MLSLITPKFKDQGELGLYHDDGITRVCKVTPRHIEKKKQEVSDVFKSNGLKFSKKSLSRRTERS